jgi:hypothetical protein
MEEADSGEPIYKERFNQQKKKSKFTTIQHDEVLLINSRVPLALRANDPNEF